MTTDEPAKKMVKLLKEAGFEATRTRGSHSIFEKGSVSVAVPTGHKTISPGVVRQIHKAIKEAE